MHSIEPLLQKLGLSEKEIKVYLAVLGAGSASVRKLGELAGINRGSTYDALKSLREHGLVSYFHKQKKQYFTVEDPDKLHALVAARQTELRELHSTLQDVIPELQSLFNEGGGKPVARFYEGKEGVKTILEDVLQTMKKHLHKEYYVYSNSVVRDELYDEFPDYNKKRIEAGVIVKTISLGQGGQLAGLDERKWIAAAGQGLTYLLVYGGKCAFISYDRTNNLVGVIIENEGIYQTQKLIFSQLWQFLPGRQQ